MTKRQGILGTEAAALPTQTEAEDSSGVLRGFTSRYFNWDGEGHPTAERNAPASRGASAASEREESFFLPARNDFDARDRNDARTREIIPGVPLTRVADGSRPPFSMIVCLDLYDRHGRVDRGTGWFVGPNTVVTAGHCLWNSQSGEPNVLIKGYPGRIGSTYNPNWAFESRSFVVHEAYHRYRLSNRGLASLYDYAALFVSAPIGKKVGSFGIWLASPQEAAQSLLNISGYQGADYIMRGCTRRASRVSDKSIHYAISTTPGTSGAPVYVFEGAHQYSAVGIHTHGFSSNAQENGGVYIDHDVAARLVEWEEYGRKRSV